MEIFYTNIYNLIGPIQKKQETVATFAEELGFRELSLFHFPDEYDNDDELQIRMDGIFSAFCNDSVLFFQYPSCISTRYDRVLVSTAKRYRHTKLVIWLEDLGSWANPEGYSDLQGEIEILNQADLLILPSSKMKEFLLSNGLKGDIASLYQEIWDAPESLDVDFEPGEVKIADLRVSNNDRDQFNIPFEMGLYLLNEIPVLVNSNNNVSEMVSKYHLGMVTDTFENYDYQPDYVTQDLIVSSLHSFQPLIKQGIFTKKLLITSVQFSVQNQILS